MDSRRLRRQFGHRFPFIPGQSACFRCLLPVLPSVNETCDTAGIIAPAVQIVAARQTAEALKWLTGNKEAMMTKLLHFDVWNNSQVEAGISRIRNAHCETCGGTPTYPSLYQPEGTHYAVLCGRETVQDHTGQWAGFICRRMGCKWLSDWVQNIGRHRFSWNSMRQGYRCVLFQNGRLLIHGLKDMKEGRKLYHQFFG